MYSFWSHISGSADEGVSNRINRLRCDAKIAKLDLAARVDKNVGRFDVPMHDTVGLVKVHQTTKDRLCYFAQDVDTYWSKVFRDAIQSSKNMEA